jgi:acyl-coenzyme A thioesterase PaaI-like protein
VSNTQAAAGVTLVREWARTGRLAPAAHRFGIEVTEAELCATTTRMPLVAGLLRPDGRSSAAVTAMLGDVALATATVASLPHVGTVTTVSMTIDHLRPVPLDGDLTAVCRAQEWAPGTLQHAGGHVYGTDGPEPVAVVSAWFVSMILTDEAAASLPVTAPYQPNPRDKNSGSSLDDRLELARIENAGDGEVRLQLAATRASANGMGTLHGGVGALTCGYAAELLLGPQARLLTSSYNYLRPVPTPASVAVRAAVVRRGRRTATASASLTGPDGRDAVHCAITAGVGG